MGKRKKTSSIDIFITNQKKKFFTPFVGWFIHKKVKDEKGKLKKKKKQ